jgi:hypothetical protein
VTAKEWVDLLIEQAGKLREAGVLTLSIGDAHATLSKQELALPEPASGELEPEPADPLDDPLTYGRRAGLPGYQLPADEVDEAPSANAPGGRRRQRR